MPGENCSFFWQIRGSLIGAGILLVLDGAVYGSLLFSVLVCPIWFLIALVNVFIRRKKLGASVTKVLVPVLTILLVLGNATLQSHIARTNAAAIIEACTQYWRVNGVFPKILDELVPKYLEAVPRAKYALILGEFRYWERSGQHTLMWVSIPPFGHAVYSFEQARWGYRD